MHIQISDSPADSDYDDICRLIARLISETGFEPYARAILIGVLRHRQGETPFEAFDFDLYCTRLTSDLTAARDEIGAELERVALDLYWEGQQKYHARAT